MQQTRVFVGVFLFVVMAFTTTVLAQYDDKYPEPIPKLRGSLFLHGGGLVTTEHREKFLSLAGGKAAKIVVIPTADYDDAVKEYQIRKWNEYSPASVTILHAENREQALAPEFCAPLKSATGVWITGGRQTRLADAYLDTPMEAALQEVIRRGGVVGGTSAGAAITTKVMIVRGEERRGFDLLPGAVVDQHFVKRNREERLRNILAAHPTLVGLGVDEDTALVVQGRTLSVVGDSTATVLVAEGGGRGERKELLSSDKKADLIAYSRAAIARRLDFFPPRQPRTPSLASGALVIVGGGKLPATIMDTFLTLAGGKDAPLVYIPCEEADAIPKEPPMLEGFRKAGAKNVTWIHTKDRDRANADDAILKPLSQAKGVWFGGGRQWNLVDSYQNTKVHKLLHDLLARGGVIGGSSAGASIQGDYMPRGNPLGNIDIMAEGYERGLGFLTGVAIDQHFAQRDRFNDMSMLVKTYPQLLGIGLDEGTALVVQKSEARVLGKGNVAVYDARRPRVMDDKEYLTLHEGQRFDLQKRLIVSPPPTP